MRNWARLSSRHQKNVKLVSQIRLCFGAFFLFSFSGVCVCVAYSEGQIEPGMRTVNNWQQTALWAQTNNLPVLPNHPLCTCNDCCCKHVSLAWVCCAKVTGLSHERVRFEKEDTHSYSHDSWGLFIAQPVAGSPEGRPGMFDCLPPVWNLRAVIWFSFPIPFCFVFLPSPLALSVLSFFC